MQLDTFCYTQRNPFHIWQKFSIGSLCGICNNAAYFMWKRFLNSPADQN